MLIEIGGLRLLTDPLLRGRIAHLRRYGRAPSRDLAERLDAVLISHLHADHLDRPSLRRLAPETAIVAPSGAAALIGRWSSSPISELKPGESLEFGVEDASPGLKIQATEADHDGRRRPFGPRAEPVGYELSFAGRRIYFAGDTGLFPGMANLAGGSDRPLDIALVPIWGWGPTLGPGHLDPDSAARAVALMRPRIAVPIHWGTLFPVGMGRWSNRYLIEPPQRFAAQVAALSPATEVRVLAPGESLASADVPEPAKSA